MVRRVQIRGHLGSRCEHTHPPASTELAVGTIGFTSLAHRDPSAALFTRTLARPFDYKAGGTDTRDMAPFIDSALRFARDSATLLAREDPDDVATGWTHRAKHREDRYNDDGEGLSRGAKAGIILGSIVGVAVLGYLVVWLLGKQKTRRRAREEEAGRRRKMEEGRGSVESGRSTPRAPERVYRAPWSGVRRSPSYWMERRDEREERERRARGPWAGRT